MAMEIQPPTNTQVPHNFRQRPTALKRRAAVMILSRDGLIEFADHSDGIPEAENTQVMSRQREKARPSRPQSAFRGGLQCPGYAASEV
jgi:hypothetical protein